MKNTEDIATLKERVIATENEVADLLETVENGGTADLKTNSVAYFVGDSITYGTGAENYGTLEAGYVKHVIARLGYDKTKSKNLGVSGAGFVQVSPGSNGVKLRNIVDANSFAPADDVYVAAAVNDWKNWQITLADFWAEMKYCLTKIRTDNPHCRIFYVLPYNCKASGWTGCTYDTHWALGYKGDSSAEKCFGYILKDFRKLILDKFETDEDLKALGVHVISIMPITRGNIDQITVDGLHPNAEGYKIIGSLLSQIAATT
jgi:lysophospholipase L1-like esterase